MYLFVRYGHLIRHGVAVPPTFAKGKLAKFAARTLFSHDAMFAKQTCHGAKRSRKAYGYNGFKILFSYYWYRGTDK